MPLKLRRSSVFLAALALKEKLMKVFFTTSFIGHYPVGTAAVVIAENQEQAYQQMCELLKEEELWDAQTYHFQLQFNKEDMIELDITHPMAVMLNNGNY
jgi:hypothetical protein